MKKSYTISRDSLKRKAFKEHITTKEKMTIDEKSLDVLRPILQKIMIKI